MTKKRFGLLRRASFQAVSTTARLARRRIICVGPLSVASTASTASPDPTIDPTRTYKRLCMRPESSKAAITDEKKVNEQIFKAESLSRLLQTFFSLRKFVALTSSKRRSVTTRRAMKITAKDERSLTWRFRCRRLHVKFKYPHGGLFGVSQYALG